MRRSLDRGDRQGPDRARRGVASRTRRPCPILASRSMIRSGRLASPSLRGRLGRGQAHGGLTGRAVRQSPARAGFNSSVNDANGWTASIRTALLPEEKTCVCCGMPFEAGPPTPKTAGGLCASRNSGGGSGFAVCRVCDITGGLGRSGNCWSRIWRHWSLRRRGAETAARRVADREKMQVCMFLQVTG